jgi:hypothetical protein
MINIINLIERRRRDHPAVAVANRSGRDQALGVRAQVRSLSTKVGEDDYVQDDKDL